LLSFSMNMTLRFPSQKERQKMPFVKTGFLKTRSYRDR
jgi:hypothetical protein